MATYHKHMINNALVKSIYEGGEYADHLDLFLKMMMVNDLEKTGAYLPTSLIFYTPLTLPLFRQISIEILSETQLSARMNSRWRKCRAS